MNIKDRSNKKVVESMTDEELETIGQMITDEIKIRVDEIKSKIN
jgi:hypothetical protein